MRNFSKTLISMAAVMAVGSAMAAGAMAAELKATYVDTDSDNVNDSVKIEGVTTTDSKGNALTQYTLLVLAKDETGEFVANESTIKQIDQNDNGEAFTSAVVGELKDGSYKIMVGNNDGTVDSGILTVSSTPVVPPVDKMEIYVGDCNLDKSVNTTDLTNLKRFTAGLSSRVGKLAEYKDAPFYEPEDTEKTTPYYVGDCNLDKSVNTTDLTNLKRFTAGLSSRVGKLAEYKDTPVTVIKQ